MKTNMILAIFVRIQSVFIPTYSPERRKVQHYMSSVVVILEETLITERERLEYSSSWGINAKGGGVINLWLFENEYIAVATYGEFFYF
jgi:hypothetical protein